MRRLLPLLACCLLAAGCGQDEPRSAAPDSPGSQRAVLAGSPAPLAALHRQANRLLGGGTAAFRARLRELRGHPVVVNKWASWCPPCRSEFPFFQRQALRRGRRIAFLGVDSNDSASDARAFLRKLPLSYPSYSDPKLGIAAELHAVQAFPATSFYDREGKLSYVHLGGYPSERKLAADIARYAR